jgi:hypothetical protein
VLAPRRYLRRPPPPSLSADSPRSTTGCGDRIGQVRYTTETSLQVVPGFLRAGMGYFHKVTALTGGIDVLSAPHLAHGRFGATTVVSGQFTR